jgi:hypothetical protein
MAAAVIVFAIFQIGRCARHGDTKFFFAAGGAVLTGGDPYVDSVVGGGYLYPPFFTVLMVPFYLMPRLLAETLWFALNFASLVVLFATSLYLLEAPAEPDRILLYEIYDDRAAFEAHKNSPHYAAFDAQSAPLVAAKSAMEYDLVCEGSAA